jgi:hypothetical protein
MGLPKPVVVERSPADRVGGTFAMSTQPVFYLNSETRPGNVPGIPARGEALNVLPGATLQPSQMTNAEFPTNADMAWLIRLTLAQYAEVYPGVTVDRVNPRTMQVTFADGREARWGRIIDARGVGDPVSADVADGETILTFPQFMARMGRPFPLRGLRKVAVVGSGDSAKCATEALVGIGPGGMYSLPGLDFVSTIDWYAPALPATNEAFRASQRCRYARLSSYLPSLDVPDAYHDVTVIPDRATVRKSLDGVLVNDSVYDMVIMATGNVLPGLGAVLPSDFDNARVGGTRGNPVATQYGSYELYQVGPAANLPFTPGEVRSGVANIAANKVAMFRLAGRTATLAANLPAITA